MPVDPTRLHIPAGTGGDGSDPLVLTPERCGWSFAGLRVVRLAAGERRAIETGDDELAMTFVALEDAYGLHIVGGNALMTVEVAGAAMRAVARDLGCPTSSRPVLPIGPR